MTDGTTAINWAGIVIASTTGNNSCECGCDSGKDCPNTCEEPEPGENNNGG